MIGPLVLTALVTAGLVAWLVVLSRRQRALAVRLALHVCREPAGIDHGRHTRQVTVAELTDQFWRE